MNEYKAFVVMNEDGTIQVSGDAAQMIAMVSCLFCTLHLLNGMSAQNVLDEIEKFVDAMGDEYKAHLAYKKPEDADDDNA